MDGLCIKSKSGLRLILKVGTVVEETHAHENHRGTTAQVPFCLDCCPRFTFTDHWFYTVATKSGKKQAGSARSSAQPLPPPPPRPNPTACHQDDEEVDDDDAEDAVVVLRLARRRAAALEPATASPLLSS